MTYWCLIGNGWVAGGCWDDDMKLVMIYGSFPKIPCVKRTSTMIYFVGVSPCFNHPCAGFCWLHSSDRGPSLPALRLAPYVADATNVLRRGPDVYPLDLDGGCAFTTTKFRICIIYIYMYTYIYIYSYSLVHQGEMSFCACACSPVAPFLWIRRATMHWALNMLPTDSTWGSLQL